ncbi:hypothetical protein ACHAWF_006877 [Thalassiosira exigua]
MPPETSPWAIGTLGTPTTCTIQGFLITTFEYAFPFYYASFSILAYVSLKNDFKESNYAWMEKFIHLGAYILPLSVAIIAVAKNWYSSGLAYCIVDRRGHCSHTLLLENGCIHTVTHVVYTLFGTIIITELLVGTFTIVYILFKFDDIIKKIEQTTGMRRIRETARIRMLKDVGLQTGLYLLSFWFGYVPYVADFFLRHTTGKLSYGLVITSQCVLSFQGFIIMVIYFVLQRKPEEKSLIPTRHLGVEASVTVSRIRANAANPKRPSESSTVFSFRIFDGTPVEDSPWLEYLVDSSDQFETVMEEDEEDVSGLNSSLLPGNKDGHS